MAASEARSDVYDCLALACVETSAKIYDRGETMLTFLYRATMC